MSEKERERKLQPVEGHRSLFASGLIKTEDLSEHEKSVNARTTKNWQKEKKRNRRKGRDVELSIFSAL